MHGAQAPLCGEGALCCGVRGERVLPLREERKQGLPLCRTDRAGPLPRFGLPTASSLSRRSTRSKRQLDEARIAGSRLFRCAHGGHGSPGQEPRTQGFHSPSHLEHAPRWLTLSWCWSEYRVCPDEEAQGAIEDRHEKGASLCLGEKPGKRLLECCQPATRESGIVVVQLGSKTVAGRERIQVNSASPQELLRVHLNVAEHVRAVCAAKQVQFVHDDEQVAHLLSNSEKKAFLCF